MNTLTIEQVKQNSDLLLNNFGKTPIVLKNENNQTMLVLPFSMNNWNEIYLTLYQTFIELNSQKTDLPQPIEEKKSAVGFFNKWHGFMKDVEIDETWRDEYTKLF